MDEPTECSLHRMAIEALMYYNSRKTVDLHRDTAMAILLGVAASNGADTQGDLQDAIDRIEAKL